MPRPTFGFVKLFGSSGSHCTKWADEHHRPAGFESRLVPDPPFNPTLIGLRAFDLVSSVVWWKTLANIDSRRETQYLKAYANHTMLTPPQRAVHLVMFKISIHLCQSRSEKFNRHRNGRKLNSRLYGRIPNYCLFKILTFSGPSLLGMTSSTLLPYFLFGGLLWQIVFVISFPRECKTALNDYASGLRDLNGSMPYQTEWWNIINEKWSIKKIIP